MSSGQTRRSANQGRRPDLDRTAVRHFVYTLLDGAGDPVYVGRSCNVRNRIAAHAASANGRAEGRWIYDVRSVTMFGPFNWDDAVHRERDAIERLQPRANRALTARDHRLQIAIRSAARAER